MKYLFKRNNKAIQEINRDYVEGKLFADLSYPKKKEWHEQDKIKLIETILTQFVIPEVIFWTTDRNPDTGVASTYIVDGQQRINAIVDFINGEFSLDEKYLINKEIKACCGKKSFKELDQSYKNIIWNYPISIVEIGSECTSEDVRKLVINYNLSK